MHSSLCSATSPVIAPRRACTATREPPLRSEARESPRAATEAQQSQTKEQYLKPKQSPKTCRSPQDNAYFLPSVMRPKIHAHAHLPVTQTAKGTRTHLPAGGDPGEERTLSPRNTTASQRGRTPVCPTEEERTPRPPDSPLASRRGRTPVRRRKRRQLGLPGLRLRRVLQDPLHLLLDLPGPQQPAIVVEPDLEVAAPVEDDDVLAVPQVLDGVCWGVGRQAPRGTWLEDARTQPRRHHLLSPSHSAPLRVHFPQACRGLWAGAGLGAGFPCPHPGRVTRAKGPTGGGPKWYRSVPLHFRGRPDWNR